MSRKKVQRSGSFSEVEGDMTAGRLSVNLPKRSHSFRSCLKKPSTVETPPSQCSSRHSSGSKAVMFTDEIGECLVEVKKYVESEPFNIIDNDNKEPQNSKPIDDESIINNVENVHHIDAQSDFHEHAPKKSNAQNKIFGNPNIKKSQSFNHTKRSEVQKSKATPECPPCSPLTSSDNPSPLCSPEMNPRMVSIIYPNRSIEKSQSFCNKMAPLMEDKSLLNLSFKKLTKTITPPQPTIILTSPTEDKDDPMTHQRKVSVGQMRIPGLKMFRPNEANEKLRIDNNKIKIQDLEATFDKLSENLIRESLQTYMAIQQYSGKDSYRNMIKDNFSVSKLDIEQDITPSRPVRKVSNTCPPCPPPPPTSAPPPLPQI